MVKGTANYGAIVQLIGHNAWIVALYLIAFGSLASVIIVKDSAIICYTCLALIILLTISVIVALIIITKRENKVTPDLPYITDTSTVRKAMREQEEATDEWR